MLILVFLKMMADLGFYSTFAGLLGAISAIEIQPFVIVVSVPAMALVFTLSYLLRNRKRLRFLPFLLVPLAAFLPGFNLPAAVFLLPMVVYMVILAAKKLYEPDYPNARDLFSLYWKLAIVALIIAAITELLGGQKTLSRGTIPLILLTLTASVLLMRTLRHEPSAYRRPSVVLLNVGILLLVLAGAFVLSNEHFQNGVVWFLRIISAPVVYLLSAFVIGVTRLFMWLMSLLPYNGPQDEITPSATEETAPYETSETPETDVVIPPGIERVLTVVAILITILVIVLLIRWLLRHRNRFSARKGSAAEERSTVSGKPRKRGFFDRSSDLLVRRQYQKYLKHSVHEGVSLPISSTSLDVAKKTRGYFSQEYVEELRDIYVAARYDGVASGEAAARAKELVREMKKYRADQENRTVPEEADEEE